MASIIHLATQEWWQVTDGDKLYTVRRYDHWIEGEQQWKVTQFTDDAQIDVDGEKFHELVREIQQHLVRRD